MNGQRKYRKPASPDRKAEFMTCRAEFMDRVISVIKKIPDGACSRLMATDRQKVIVAGEILKIVLEYGFIKACDRSRKKLAKDS